jgi:hypothetical protein
MTSDKKSTIDMALGTATCASFAIPEVGAVLGGIIAGGQFVFDIYYPADAVDPASLTASKGDIDRATEAIQTAINDAAFTIHRNNVSTFANDFQEMWKRMQVRPEGLSPATWSSISARLKVQCDSYFNEVTATDNLKNAIRWMEAHNCPNNMVGVYLLAVGLLVAYHKTGLNWDINGILDTYRTSEAAYRDFVNRFEEWKNAPNNGQGPPPLAAERPLQPTMKEMVSTNFHAMLLHDDILPEFIAKATTIRDGWQNRWDSRKRQLADAHQQFITRNPGLDPVQQQIKWGSILAYQYNNLTNELNLHGIASEEDIGKVGQTIDRWKAIKADLDAAIGSAQQA